MAVACEDEDIDVYDLEDGEHIDTISPPNPSTSVWALAVDQNNVLFIGNGGTNEISRHKEKERPVKFLTNLEPWFIAANCNIRQILVSSWREGRVDGMNYEGQFLFSITSRGPDGPLQPSGVCFNGDDTIFIAHKGENLGKGEVHRYNAANGGHLGVVTTGLNNPHGICVGYKECLVVADWEDVKIFKRRAIKLD